ncbi:GMC oxidoreductase [Salinarimonas sp.]|uniref:GMC oxidoreductase n=1 Tax=Salinarimonas sp. TaxID=2766526 RepID=UPI0032D94EF6
MSVDVGVLIVGAGLSGSAALARLLRAAPRERVLVVDEGGDPANGTGAEAARVVLRASDRTATTLDPWWTDRRLGGAANLWYGQISRFEPIDFASLAFPGEGGSVARSRPWPIDRAALDPFYDFVETLLSPVSAAPALNPGARLPEGWTARRRVGRAERAIHEALAAGGWEPHAGATCLGGHAWAAAPIDPVTLAPLRSGGPADHARNPVWHTRRATEGATRATLWVGARVLSVAPRGDDLEVRVERADGVARVRARAIVLACGVLETVALLRRSGLTHPRLGRDFTFTTEATAYVATDLRRCASATELAIARMAAISTKGLYAPSVPGLVKGGKISAYDARGFEGDARHERKIRAATGSDPDLLSPASRLTVKLSFKGESVAWEGKRIAPPEPTAIDGAEHVLDYTPHPHDRRLVARVRAAFAEIAALFPGGRVIASSDNVDGRDRSSAHLHGGAICGTCAAAAVTDRDCALFAEPRLFVADASIMPSSGATNSSLTAMANAARVADAVAARL